MPCAIACARNSTARRTRRWSPPVSNSNRSYDGFVARFGPISARANTSAFRGDPDLPLAAVAGAVRRGDRPGHQGRHLPGTHHPEAAAGSPGQHRQGSAARHAQRTRLRGPGLHRRPAPPQTERSPARPEGPDLPQPPDPPLGDRGRVPVRQRPREAGGRRGRGAGGRAVQTERRGAAAGSTDRPVGHGD